MLREIKCEGGLRGNGCACLVDIETGVTVEYCIDHKPIVKRKYVSAKKHDAKFEVPFPFDFNRR
jgi:hypothetical protein